VGPSPPTSAIRQGNFKLLQFFEDGGRVELYDLAQDPGETVDLATRSPAKTKERLRLLTQWQQDTQAALPVGPNPNFDAAASRPRGRNQSATDNPQGKGRNRKQGSQRKQKRK